MTRTYKYCSLILLLAAAASAQNSIELLVPSGISSRRTTISNIDFSIFNDGSLFYDSRNPDPFPAIWPRQVGLGGFLDAGFWFGCVKGGKKLVSPTSGSSVKIGSDWRYFTGIFDQFVPGYIGDPSEPPDTAFGGIGWKYVDKTNYIVYASTDYDTSGVDISGNNFPDWPIRLVGGKETYVHDVLSRAQYPAVFKSDQEFFTIFKDTDTRTDPEYVRSYALNDSMSVPIGIQVREYCYTFSGALKDAIIISFEIDNQSGEDLDSCFCGMDRDSELNLPLRSPLPDEEISYYYSEDPLLNLSIIYNPVGPRFNSPVQVFEGFDCVELPKNLKTSYWKMIDTAKYDAMNYFDISRYSVLTSLPSIDSPFVKVLDTYGVDRPYVGAYPFRMEAGESVRFSIGIMFAYTLKQLLALDAIIQLVNDNGIIKPSAPPQPSLLSHSSSSGVLLTWDSTAEHWNDPVVPDSLGKPFFGYRLYRGRASSGPFTLVHEWQVGRDTIVHQYHDTVDENGIPLRNNIHYYFRLTSFNEGIPILNGPELESAGPVLDVVLNAPASSPYQLSNIRIVPNPFVVTHAAQQSTDHPVIFFDYLPEVCTIRIYNVALQLVAIIYHQGGSSESWNLQTQGGQLVASQLLIANIQTPQGTSVVKKFAVVLSN